jgi:small subunit ribosomal protein S5e
VETKKGGANLKEKEIMLFEKWKYSNLEIEDPSLAPYISANEKFANFVPHTAGRYNNKKFKRARCPLVERVVCALMMHGRNNGKKIKAIRILKNSLEIINILTEKNPIQVLIEAIINSGPREDSTKIGSVGTMRRQAVDVSPFRRINIGIHLLTTGAREAAFRNIKTMSECLADEIINASKSSSNSYAIKKKDEIERVAKANR